MVVRTAIVFAAALAVAGASALADDWKPGGTSNTMIEVGAGTRVDTHEEPVEVLLSARFRGLHGGSHLGISGGVLGTTELYWARIETDVVLGAGDERVPEFRVRLIPAVADLTAYEGDDGYIHYGDARALEIEMFREFRVGHDFGVEVKPIAIRAGVAVPQGSGFTFLAVLAADALGYKMVDYLKGETFHGLKAIEASAEISEMLRLGGSHSFVSIVLGGSGDLAVGDSDGFAVQSDVRGYLAARLDLNEFVRFYTEGGLRYSADTGNDAQVTVSELLAGARFYF